MKKFKVRYKKEIPIFYSGSLLQQDYSESLHKGYLLWDTDSLATGPSFVEIPNDNAFYNLKVSYKVDTQNMPVIDSPAKNSSIRLILSNFDYTISEMKQIELELRKLYNPIALEVKRDFAQTKKQSTVQFQKIKSTADVTVQNELITKFLDKTDPSIIERIIKINNKIRATVSSEEIMQPNFWKVHEIDWDYTFSYGENNYLNFKNLKGITGLFAPNRSGKSNFIDTFLYVLFNKSARMSKITKIINNKVDSCRASVIIEVNGVIYKITRSSKKVGDGTSTKVILEKKIDDKWISATGDSRTDTDKIIRKLIGNFDEIVISNVSSQGKISYFLETGFDETFRLELLSKFLGLNVFKLQYDEAHRLTNEFDVLLKQFKQVDYATFIKNYHDEIEKLNDSLADLEEDKLYSNNQLDQIKIQHAVLKTMIQEVEDIAVANFDKAKIETLHTGLIVQKKSEEKLLVEETTKIERMKQLNLSDKAKEFQARVKEKEKITNELRQIESDIRVASLGLKKDKSRVEVLARQPWTETTDTCQQCEFFQEADTLKKELKRIENSQNDLVVKKSKIELQLIPVSNADKELEIIKDQLSEIQRLENQIKIRNLNIEKLALQIDKAQSILDEQNKEAQTIESIKQIKESNTQIQGLIAEKEIEIANLSKAINTTEYNLIAHNKRIGELENLIITSEADLKKMNQLEIDNNDYKLYLKCVHREGLPYMIISSYIDIINDEIHRIVGDYIPFSIKFELDYEKKSIPISIVYENGTSSPIELGSGMEKTISAIAIRAALASISNIPHCNIFMIDESFGTLDKDWISSMDKFLNQLKTMFEHVILISHVTEVMDFVDQTLTIDTSSGNSQLQF
jgi:DNA repair exonuclease SbcCD ATPase subunit